MADLIGGVRTELGLHASYMAGWGVDMAAVELYAHLGAQLDADAAGSYADWVQTYAHPDFHELAARLDALLDEHRHDPAAAGVAYRRAMLLELQFLDAANTAPG